MELLIKALALMLVLEGAPYFLHPAGMRQALLLLAQQASDRQLRLLGLLSMLLGVVLLRLLG